MTKKNLSKVHVLVEDFSSNSNRDPVVEPVDELVDEPSVKDFSSNSNRDESKEETREPESSIEKPKKPYVMTEARKASFEKARQIRMDNINIKKVAKETELNEIIKLKKDSKKMKQDKIDEKTKIREELIKKIVAGEVDTDKEETDDEPIIVKKKKSNKKKKIIYISEDDEDGDSKRNIIIVNKMESAKPDITPVIKPVRKIPLFL